MSRASRARRVAGAAAYGGGGLTALGALGVGVLKAETVLARRTIGRPFGLDGPEADGDYGVGPGEPVQLVMLGDSSADGLGADHPEATPGAIIASGLAAVTGRRVRLRCYAKVGAESSGLRAQVTRALLEVPSPDVAVIMVGANDVTHRIKHVEAVRYLADAVTRLREAGAEVVVGTVPDLGTIEPLAQPLRWIARRESRALAAAQTIAVVEAGGRTVSLGDLLGPEFSARPKEMFSSDGFHPSPAGYARAAAALLPSVCAALGVWPDGGRERAPEPRRGESVAPVAEAAVAAAADPGTEVAATAVRGDQRGPFGRWVTVLRRRRLPAVPALPGLAGVPGLGGVPFPRPHVPGNGLRKVGAARAARWAGGAQDGGPTGQDGGARSGDAAVTGE